LRQLDDSKLFGAISECNKINDLGAIWRELMDAYRVIADKLAADVAAGRLRPADRLPPQRRFARQHGIATSTAARVYGELVRRGLAVGEVGRGTFIRAAAKPPTLAEPSGARVDLELNFAVLPEQPAVLAESLGRLLRPDVLGTALQPLGVSGTTAAREAAAAMLSHAGSRNRVAFRSPATADRRLPARSPRSCRSASGSGWRRSRIRW
jgi:DNA-binding transcriptional regulator YhcF (GntR family)